MKNKGFYVINIKDKSPGEKETYRWVEGRPAIQMANNEIIKLAKSVNKWAASVAIAKLFDKMPPV